MAYSEKDRKYLMLGFRIIGEFGFIIAAPIVILALFGKWLDGRYDTAPLFLVSGFILAALLSAISIYRRAKQFGREYSAIEPEKTLEKSTSNSEQTNQSE